MYDLQAAILIRQQQFRDHSGNLDWGDDIKMDLKCSGSKTVDWIDLAQKRDQWRTHVNTATDSRILSKVGNFLTVT